MKVLFVCSGNSKFGISPIVKNQGESLKNNGVNIAYFTIKGKGFKGYLKNIPRLKKFLKSNKYDLIHAHYSLSAIAASLAGAKPIITSLMGSDIQAKTFWKLMIKFFNRISWKTTIVKSLRMREQIGISDALVIPNGVDVNRIQSIKPSSGMSFDVVYAGRLIKTKNIDILLKSLYLLKRDYKMDLKCAIIEEGPEETKLRVLVRALNLSKNVKFFGRVNEDKLISILKSSRVFVSCSTNEGFGIAFLEANAAGLPVVGIDHPNNAAKEIIFHGINGLLVNLRCREISHAIHILLTNEDLRKRMADAGKKFSLNFDWDRIAKLYLRLYERLLTVA